MHGTTAATYVSKATQRPRVLPIQRRASMDRVVGYIRYRGLHVRSKVSVCFSRILLCTRLSSLADKPSQTKPSDSVLPFPRWLRESHARVTRRGASKINVRHVGLRRSPPRPTLCTLISGVPTTRFANGGCCSKDQCSIRGPRLKPAEQTSECAM